jgi:protein-disulfide isomerase
MRTSLLIPISVVVAGLLVAFGVYSYFHSIALKQAAVVTNLTTIRPVDSTDHIFGNPTANVLLVEYSDLDSPFGHSMDEAIRALVTEGGANGTTAWVYRHFPVTDQHPNAEADAEASECAGAQSNAAFFRFLDAYESASATATPFYPVQKVGLDAGAFSTCLASHSYQKRVTDDAANASALGATGAPYTVILVGGNPVASVSGAFPVNQLQGIVTAAVEKANGAH